LSTMAGASNEQAAQLQQAMHNIDQHHHGLTQTVTGFDNLFGDHAQAAAPAAGADQGSAEFEQTIKQLHDLATQLTKEITETLQHAVEALHQSTTNTQQDTEQHSAAWDKAHDSCKQGLTTLDHTAEQAVAAATGILTSLQGSVDQITHSTQDLLHQLDQSAQAVNQTVSEHVTSTLNKAAGDFHDAISGAVSGKVTDHLTSIFNNAQESLNSLGQTAEHITQAFSQQAEQALQQFGSQVVEGAKNELEQTGEKLAKDAMEALTANVTTSIAESTAGSAITSAMAPILPEVIIVKEASEAIKDLISVFKSIASIF
jgi:hypothetical protein